MRFKNKRVVITGASSGIGKSVVENLSQEGAEVILVARREKELSSLCESIKNSGGHARKLG